MGKSKLEVVMGLVAEKIIFITGKFSNLVNSTIDQIESLSGKTYNLIKQRYLLLPRLMSGKLEV